MLSTKPSLGEPPSWWLPDFLKPALEKHHLGGFLTQEFNPCYVSKAPYRKRGMQIFLLTDIP